MTKRINWKREAREGLNQENRPPPAVGTDELQDGYHLRATIERMTEEEHKRFFSAWLREFTITKGGVETPATNAPPPPFKPNMRFLAPQTMRVAHKRLETEDDAEARAYLCGVRDALNEAASTLADEISSARTGHRNAKSVDKDGRDKDGFKVLSAEELDQSVKVFLSEGGKHTGAALTKWLELKALRAPPKKVLRALRRALDQAKAERKARR